ncbi:hypothetical protein KCU93_g7, partial [Aureobasidium melanogenum]
MKQFSKALADHSLYIPYPTESIELRNNLNSLALGEEGVKINCPHGRKAWFCCSSPSRSSFDFIRQTRRWTERAAVQIDSTDHDATRNI